jgi:hypothetical protein
MIRQSDVQSSGFSVNVNNKYGMADRIRIRKQCHNSVKANAQKLILFILSNESSSPLMMLEKAYKDILHNNISVDGVRIYSSTVRYLTPVNNHEKQRDIRQQCRSAHDGMQPLHTAYYSGHHRPPADANMYGIVHEAGAYSDKH